MRITGMGESVDLVVGRRMVLTEAWAVPVGVVGISLLLFCLQVPLWGFGPLRLKKIWTRIIRFFKGGDTRSWNWTEIEPGLYVGSLPRTRENLLELQDAPHNLGGIVSLIEPWEIRVPIQTLEQLDIQWLLLPTPDYSSPKLCDVENAVAFIDRQVSVVYESQNAARTPVSCRTSHPLTR